MPALQLNKILGALRFQATGTRLPVQTAHAAMWDKFAEHSEPDQRIAVPQLIPQWVRPVKPIKAHQLMADRAGQDLKDFHDTMCDAIAYAHNMWRLQAQFTPMAIAGPVVAGPPGSLSGPPLEPLIKQYPGCVVMIDYEADYRDAVAAGMSQSFLLWQTNVTVPGLPFYPGYVMMPPGPAVPMPNVPFPLMACVSANVSNVLAPDIMSALMMQNLPHRLVGTQWAQPIFDAISTTVSIAMASWLSSQMVLNILGTGAVASPTGGPVAGMTMPTAGHLAT